MKILNNLLNTKHYDKLNFFFARKIFKLFKIFFVETNHRNLPINNYKINKKNLLNDLNQIKIFETNNYKPYITYPNILNLLISITPVEAKLKIYDYGAGNLNLYFYLKSNLKKLDYFFYDQKEVLEAVQEVKKKNSLDSLYVESSIPINLDIVYFGSTIQYIHNFEDAISKFFKKTKYILISQTPFFEKPNEIKTIIAKQLNMHPDINYLYMFNINRFIDFMKKNNYLLVEKNFNKVTKFLNFRNFDAKYEKLDMYDLLFKYQKNE